VAAPTKDYNKIAAARIQRPANVQRQPRFHIYARQKKGKTTFSMSAGVDNTLILDPEHGTDEFKTKNPHVWPITKWADVDEAYQFLAFGTHEYTWCSLDGLTRFNNQALKHVMKIQEDRSLDRIPGLVQKQDYGKSGELMKEMLINFHNIRALGVVMTSQERMMEGSDSEEDTDAEEGGEQYVPDLPKAVRNMVNSLVDVIGRLYVVKVDKPNMEEGTIAQRRLWIGESLKYDTGYRSDFVLPDQIKNPTVPKLVRMIRQGPTSTRRAA
jgi:hypothetical protein